MGLLPYIIIIELEQLTPFQEEIKKFRRARRKFDVSLGSRVWSKEK